MKKRRTPQRRGAGPGRVVGLDLGATSVRAVSLSVTTTDGAPSASLERVAVADLPPGTVVKGVVEDQPALTTVLRQLWKDHDLPGHDVVLGVAGPQVVVRDLQIPAMDPQQQAKALPFLAKDIIALPIDSVILDYVTLGSPTPESTAVDGLLVATPRAPVVAAVGAVERAGLRVGRVDLASFAVLRSTAGDHLEAEAVVDLGAQLTTIVIHHHGVPRLVRTVPRGGQELTERLAGRLDVSLEEAEQIKRQHGLDGPDDAVTVAVRECLRPLLSEIRSSVNYFRTGNAGTQLQRIALTGGGAGLPGLAGSLTQQVGVSAVAVSPLQYLGDWWDDVADTDADPAGAPRQRKAGPEASALSIGLAMGAAA